MYCSCDIHSCLWVLPVAANAVLKVAQYKILYCRSFIRPVIRVYSYEYGYFFSYKNSSLHLRRPLESYGLLLLWIDALFGASKSPVLFAPIIKLGRARIFLNIIVLF